MTTQPALIAAGLLLTLAVGGCDQAVVDHVEEQRTTINVWRAVYDPSARIALLLKPREVSAAIMVPVFDDDIQRIADKLTKSAEADPLTFLQLMRDGATAGPPPYDPRLGISLAEYELLTTGAHLRLRKQSDAKITITKHGDDHLTITGLPDLKELTFDPGVTTVTTPYGQLARPAPFESIATQKTTGPLNGYVWRSPTPDDDLIRYQIPEILLAQSLTGDVWLKINIIDSIDRRRIVDYYVRFGGPPK